MTRIDGLPDLPKLQDRPPRLHRLKTDPEVYQAVLAGRKTFEIRLNDRDFRVGDELLLMETTATGEAIRAGAPLQFTGNELRKCVSHILDGYGLMPGWVCLSFEAGSAAAAQAAKQVPEGWVPCTITYAEGEDPEEVAFGPQRMMDRLKKWLDSYFAKVYAERYPVASLAEAAEEGQVEATFEDWWYGHDGMRQRQVAYLGWPCTKELAESIFNGAREQAPSSLAVTLRQAREALIYHQEQTRPIDKTANAIRAIGKALAATSASPQAPAPQAVVGEASERAAAKADALFDAVAKYSRALENVEGVTDTGEDEEHTELGRCEDRLHDAIVEMGYVRAALTSPAQSAAPHQGADALREDAERYRWLRDKSTPPHNFYISVPVEFDGVRYTPDEVDAGIDAARAALAQHQAPQQGEQHE